MAIIECVHMKKIYLLTIKQLFRIKKMREYNMCVLLISKAISKSINNNNKIDD